MLALTQCLLVVCVQGNTGIHLISYRSAVRLSAASMCHLQNLHSLAHAIHMPLSRPPLTSSLPPPCLSSLPGFVLPLFGFWVCRCATPPLDLVCFVLIFSVQFNFFCHFFWTSSMAEKKSLVSFAFSGGPPLLQRSWMVRIMWIDIMLLRYGSWVKNCLTILLKRTLTLHLRRMSGKGKLSACLAVMAIYWTKNNGAFSSLQDML